MSQRLEADEYFSRIARLVSRRGTCPRRQGGCVIVDKHRHIMATGYNGNAPGQPHCLDNPCPGANCESGQGLDLCEAVHAEQNALLQCRDVMLIKTVYCTTFPCVTCMKLILNTSCERIVYQDTYPHMQHSCILWEASRGYESISQVESPEFKKKRLLSDINIMLAGTKSRNPALFESVYSMIRELSGLAD